MEDEIEHRMGTPKKRFLTRRSIPMLDPWSSCHSNDKPSSSFSPTSDNNNITKQRQEEKLELNHPVVSPPLSEEEEEDTLFHTSPIKRQCLLSLERNSSEDSEYNSDEGAMDFSNEELSIIQKRVYFLESKKSLSQSSNILADGSVLVSLDEASLNASKTTAQEATLETTHRIVSTAASVLLLMRFSVTDQALDCLAIKAPSFSKISKKQPSAKQDSRTKNKLEVEEVVSRKRDRPSQPSNMVHPVTPTTIKSRMSMPDQQLISTLIRRVSVPNSTHEQECPKRLAMPEDPKELNSLHCFVRSQLLEVFLLPPQKDKPGRVGLRCLYCAHLPRKDRTGTTMCTFYPKSLQDLYRSVMTWQRIHFRLCKHVPNEMHEKYRKHKESDQTRGKTEYWVTSAILLGLEDISKGRNGIRFVFQPDDDGAKLIPSRVASLAS